MLVVPLRFTARHATGYALLVIKNELFYSGNKLQMMLCLSYPGCMPSGFALASQDDRGEQQT
jgi:hypothetical protein